MTSKWHKGSGGPAGNETGLFVAQPVLSIQGAATRTNPTSGPDGVGVSESGVAYTLEARAEVQAVAFAQPFSPHGHYRYEASEHAATLQDRENRQGGHTHLVAQAFRKSKRAQSATDDETWVDDGLANTLNGFDTGDARTTHAIAFTQNQRDEVRELGDRAASLSGQGTHQTNYVAFTIDMQACKGNANVGDGSVSPTLCKPSGNDCHAVAIGVDVYNGVETGDVAATVTNSTGSSSGSGPKNVSVCGDTTHALTSEGADASEDGTGRGTPVVAHANHGGQVAVAYGLDEEQNGAVELMGTLKARTQGGGFEAAVATSMVVRRLTPVECERLQGFPDGWTDVGTPEKPTADSHRYKQLGNAVTVNVAEWLARRIATVLKSQQ